MQCLLPLKFLPIGSLGYLSPREARTVRNVILLFLFLPLASFRYSVPETPPPLPHTPEKLCCIGHWPSSTHHCSPQAAGSLPPGTQQSSQPQFLLKVQHPFQDTVPVRCSGDLSSARYIFRIWPPKTVLSLGLLWVLRTCNHCLHNVTCDEWDKRGHSAGVSFQPSVSAAI